MKLIDLVESFNNREIELLIQDNSDNNEEIVSFLQGRTLKSVRYCYCSDKMSMSQNADLAIKNSSGEYVCFIGDDDAVCRNIADCAHWMKENSIDAVRSLYVQYVWNEQEGSDNAGEMFYDKNYGVHYRLLDPLFELKNILKQGVPDFRLLPKVYHGIVSRKVLNIIYSIGGTLFPGPTPDMSSAVALCFHIKKYAYIDYPVVLPGISKMVGGGVMGKVLPLDEVSFITDKDRDTWENGFPRLWATELIWPNCALKALRYVGHKEYIDKYFNKNKMLSRLVAVHRCYVKEAIQYADNKIIYPFELGVYIFKEGTSYLWRKKILKKITGLEDGKLITKKGLAGIADGEKHIVSLIDDFEFDKLIQH